MFGYDRRRFLSGDSNILAACVLWSTLLLAAACARAQSTDSDQHSTAPGSISTQSSDTYGAAPGTTGTETRDSIDAEPQDGSQEQQTVDAQDKAAVFDIDVLIDRMKQTEAIGVISKLSLKNQVDDLLEKAEEIKKKEPDSDISAQKSALREDFEGLILKTVTLLTKGEDFSLAEDIYLAREELWKSIMENKA